MNKDSSQHDELNDSAFFFFRSSGRMPLHI